MPISTIGSNSLNQTSDLTINGQTVGKGGGNVATNTVHGVSAGAANTTGDQNTFIGTEAGYSNVTGVENTFVGRRSGYLNTGNYNTALGTIALRFNTSGASNTAIGDSALYANTTASNNTAVGVQAGYTNTTSGYNVFVGYRAGYTSNATAVANAGNVCVGGNAGSSLTTGAGNIFIGSDGSNAAGGAGSGVTTGSNNVIIGGNTGSAAPISATGSNYIVLADGAGNPRITVDNGGKTRIGHVSSTPDSQVSTRNTGRQAYFFTTQASNGQDVCNVGNANGGYSFNAFRFWNGDIDSGSVVGSIACTTSATAYNTSSDYRLKNTIFPMTGALDKVTRLKPVTYKWNLDNSSSEGFIAHELAEVCPDAVTGEKDAVDANGKPVYQGIDTSFLVATLTAAIQELKTIVDAQAAEIAELKAKVA
jgi:hypothetical protein